MSLYTQLHPDDSSSRLRRLIIDEEVKSLVTAWLIYDLFIQFSVVSCVRMSARQKYRGHKVGAVERLRVQRRPLCGLLFILYGPLSLDTHAGDRTEIKEHMTSAACFLFLVGGGLS